MNDSEEQEFQKASQLKWIRTDWNNQGWVCLIEDRIYFTVIKGDPQLNERRVIRESMSLEEWEDIPEDLRVAEKEEAPAYKRPYGKASSKLKSKRLAKRFRL